MSVLTVNTDAYSRLRVPYAIAVRLVDEWIESCKSSQHEPDNSAPLVELEKVRRYLQLADRDVRHSGARSKRVKNNRISSVEHDYRDFLMMANGTIDAIEGILSSRSGGRGLTSNPGMSRYLAEVRKSLQEMIDAVDGFEGPTLTRNERGWLEEYVRQLQECFPEQVADVKVCSSDHDPELKTLVLIRDEGQKTERKISRLGYTIDMSSFYIGPLIRVLTVDEWEQRRLTGSPIFFDEGEREGVSVL